MLQGSQGASASRLSGGEALVESLFGIFINEKWLVLFIALSLCVSETKRPSRRELSDVSHAENGEKCFLFINGKVHWTRIIFFAMHFSIWFSGNKLKHGLKFMEKTCKEERSATSSSFYFSKASKALIFH